MRCEGGFGVSGRRHRHRCWRRNLVHAGLVSQERRGDTGRPARSPVYCLLPSTDRRAKNQLSNVRPPTSATAVFGSLKCTSATSPRFHVAGICWEDEQSRVFQDLLQPATPTTPRPLLSVHSGVKTELLDAVKARKLVYYGHRGQGKRRKYVHGVANPRIEDG